MEAKGRSGGKANHSTSRTKSRYPLLALLLALCGCERQSASPRWDQDRTAYADYGKQQIQTGTSAQHIDDAANQFLQNESRLVRESHISLEPGAAMWLSTGWTYAPDAIEGNLHHARMMFGCVRRKSIDHYFLLAVCTARGPGDALVGIDVIGSFNDPLIRRSSQSRETSLHPIPNGLVTSYVCDLTKSEIETAGREGLFIRYRHQSSPSYELMYPADFFRGLMSGIDSRPTTGELGRRRLQHYLTGGSQPTPVTPSTTQGHQQTSAETTEDFLSTFRAPPAQPSIHGFQPPLTEEQALELARTLSRPEVISEADKISTATQQAVGRCAAAMGAANSEGRLGHRYSDPELAGPNLDPSKLVGGRYGNGPLPSKSDRDRVYRFAYSLGARGVDEETAKTAAILFAVRLFGRGHQAPPPASSIATPGVDSQSSPHLFLGDGSSTNPPADYPRVQIWRSEQDGCAAIFPSKPQRLDAASAAGKGHAFQSFFQFDNDLMAMAQITIMPRTDTLAGLAAENMLAEAHEAYARTVAAPPSDSTTRKAKFASSMPALEFEVRYTIDQVSVVSAGYWILDSGRVLRVNVVYPTFLPERNVAVARHFPRTFSLVSQTATPGLGSGKPAGAQAPR